MPNHQRIVIPGAIHHVTQRGARRQQTFFCPEDYVMYRDLLAERCDRYGVELLQYCLMPNHVHLLARPSDATGLSRALGAAHSLYARRVNARRQWRGHFWQARFWSHAVFGRRVISVVRYIAQNPVRGGLASDPWAWRPSSARDLAFGQRDPWLSSLELRSYLDGWEEFLLELPPSAETELVRHHVRTGEPMYPYRETRSVA